MNYMFYNCLYWRSLNLSNFNIDKVNNISYVFYNCSSLTSINVTNLNINNVTDMSDIFSSYSYLISLNVSNFNTNNVTNFYGMVFKCSINSLDLSILINKVTYLIIFSLIVIL